MWHTHVACDIPILKIIRCLPKVQLNWASLSFLLSVCLIFLNLVTLLNMQCLQFNLDSCHLCPGILLMLCLFSHSNSPLQTAQSDVLLSMDRGLYQHIASFKAMYLQPAFTALTTPFSSKTHKHTFLFLVICAPATSLLLYNDWLSFSASSYLLPTVLLLKSKLNYSPFSVGSKVRESALWNCVLA